MPIYVNGIQVELHECMHANCWVLQQSALHHITQFLSHTMKTAAHRQH